ncbi:MAG: DUF6788 family protein [Chloroflexota bacterium]
MQNDQKEMPNPKEMPGQVKQSIPSTIVPLPGCLLRQWVRCGKANCRCAQGHPHGPYWYRYFRDEEGRAHKKYVPATHLTRAKREIAERRWRRLPLSKLKAQLQATARLLAAVEKGDTTSLATRWP